MKTIWFIRRDTGIVNTFVIFKTNENYILVNPKIDMAENLSTLILNAPVERVWDALTKPELVKLWQFGSELTTSWEVGSGIRFSVTWNGKLYEQWGEILEIRPMELIRYSLFAPRPDLEDKPENYFIMNYFVSEIKGKVKLEILQEDNRPNAVQEEPQGEENPVLKILKEIVESAD